MTYLSDIATAIKHELPSDLVPDGDADDLMLLYALLCLAVGSSVSKENVHDAWTAWMIQRGEAHESMVPYVELDGGTRAEDEPFVAAIRRVARSLGLN